jgi:hypothetical protein
MMTEKEIRNYLEGNLKSHENDIMDSADRLVWISDVKSVVVKLFAISDVSKMLPDLLGLDNPYPLKDVVGRLKWATEYLLNKKSYDGHNYEELEQCVRRADEIMKILEGNFC